MSALEELDVMCRTSSFCWASSMESCDAEMVACEGRESSIVEAVFEAATDEGSVSGSKSAFSILASFAESAVLGVEIAMVIEKW